VNEISLSVIDTGISILVEPDLGLLI